MGDTRYTGRFEGASRSRSRSPFRKNFNERPNDDSGKKIRPRRGRDDSRDKKPSMGRNRVFVNNIPFECRWMELKDLFREKVGDVSFVELFEDDKGKFNGTGIVEFKDLETAKKAIDVMHKFEYRGRLLNVKEDMESDRGRGSRLVPPRGMDRDRLNRGDMGFGNNDFRSEPNYNTYGLNPEFLKSLGVVGPLNTKIFISNLDYKVTEKKLEEIFKIAGKLLKVDLNVDVEGKSKGHAIAEFDHPLEAVQAISMFSGQRLYARVMNVRMDKFADDDASPSKLPGGLHGIGKGLGVSGQPMLFHKNSGASNGGSFGLGIGGSLGSGLSGGGMGVSASSLGMVSNPGMGLSSGVSLGMNNSMSSDRGMMNNPAMGMNLGASNLGASAVSVGMGGMGGPSGMMTSGGMTHSSLDNVGRDNFQLSSAAPNRGFRDGFERNNESFNNSALSDTILLGNLPSSFSWQTLKDRFRDIGEVRFAEMKGQGTALIRFSSVQEAQRAVDLMNNVRMDGRLIQVRFY